MMNDISTSFLKEASHYFELGYPRIDNCLNRLTEEQIWQRPNGISNSIGNLILHLCGNIRQYIVSGLGENEDIRQRSLEFSTTGGITKAALLAKLKETCQEAAAVIQSCTTENLMKKRIVQGFDITGMGIVVHVVEHYSYHVGQIAFHTKQLTAEDLGFYADMDLDITN